MKFKTHETLIALSDILDLFHDRYSRQNFFNFTLALIELLTHASKGIFKLSREKEKKSFCARYKQLTLLKYLMRVLQPLWTFAAFSVS
jgi:hypothetical protein